jgi:adenine deaminase
VADQLGTIEPGKLAHLTVVEKGRYFDEDAKVREVWIDGRQFLAPIKDDPKKDADANAEAKPTRKRRRIRKRKRSAANSPPHRRINIAIRCLPEGGLHQVRDALDERPAGAH